MWQMAMSISGISGVMHYGGWLVFLAGSCFALLAVGMLTVRSWQNWKGEWQSSKPLPISLLVLNILIESRIVALGLVSLIAFVSGVSVGVSYEKTVQLHPVVSYTMRVVERYSPYDYLVQEIDPITRIPLDTKAGEPHIWRECPVVSYADLDPGMIVEVTDEFTSCGHSFENQDHLGTGWTVLRDHETSKFIDYRGGAQ